MPCRLRLNEAVSRIVKEVTSTDPRPIGTKGFVSAVEDSNWTMADFLFGNLPAHHLNGKHCWPIKVQPAHHPDPFVFSCACEWEPISGSRPSVETRISEIV